MTGGAAFDGARSIKEIEDAFQVETYKKMDIALVRGEGSWVWTDDGRKYLDLYGGHAVCATGHSHPAIVAAIREQAEKLLFYSNLVYSDIRAAAARKLVSIAPEGLTKAFFCSSGTEANENAMRMARFATGRKKIVSLSGGFHGRTADSISATFLGKYRTLGEPNVPFHEEAAFGDAESVRAAVDKETAAVLLEPIQSMAGVREAPPEYFQELRAICEGSGALLIFDEVQTGVGRTGSWFFGGSEYAGSVVPDIISTAKSLGSGVPVGACIVSEKVSARINTNDLGTTFGGGMLAMAAVAATLEVIENEDLVANARRVEEAVRSGCSSLPSVVGIRGKGCLLGIEFDRPASEVHKHLLSQNIITGTSSDPNVLRLLPPLCLASEEVNIFLAALGSL